MIKNFYTKLKMLWLEKKNTGAIIFVFFVFVFMFYPIVMNCQYGNMTMCSNEDVVIRAIISLLIIGFLFGTKPLFFFLNKFISKKLIFLLVSIFAFIFSIIALVLPVRCTPIVHYPASGSMSYGDDLPSVQIPATDQRICTSIYRREFWVGADVLKQEVDVIFGPIWNTLNELDHYNYYGGHDVRERIVIHPLYAANYADDSILMGASHNVFVGRVIAQAGNKELAESPITQFSVEVISNTKGDLKDTVVINQLAGYRDGVLHLMDEESTLLETGSTYLFATRYNAEDDTHTLNSHPNASKLLSSDATLDKKALKALVDKDEKVRAFEAAYPDEELLEADVYHANIRNNFQSLPPDAKAAAQARAEAARAALKENAPAQP